MVRLPVRAMSVAAIVLVLLAAGCQPALPGLEAPPPVSAADPFFYRGPLEGLEAVLFEYRVNGGPAETLRFDPARGGPLEARPRYPRSWPAVAIDWRWLESAPGEAPAEVGAGTQVLPGMFTDAQWQLERSGQVYLFAARGAPRPPGAEPLARDYGRLKDLYIGPSAGADAPIFLYVFASQADFARFTSAAEEAVGVAETEFRRAYVTRTEDAQELRRHLVHEMAHLLIGTYTLPWVTEGLARMAEDPLQPDGYLDGVLQRLGRRIRIEGGPALGTAGVVEKYDYGYAFFTYLHDRYGPESFRALLAAARLVHGDMEAAMAEVFGRSPADLEHDFGQAVLARLAGDMSLWQGGAP